MLTINPDYRPETKDFYVYVKQEYSKKYNKNSSIDSLIRCFHSSLALNTSFCNLCSQNSLVSINKRKTPITFLVVTGIQGINNKNFNYNNFSNINLISRNNNDFNSQYIEYILTVRRVVSMLNYNFQQSGVLDFTELFNYFTDKIHRETIKKEKIIKLSKTLGIMN